VLGCDRYSYVADTHLLFTILKLVLLLITHDASGAKFPIHHFMTTGFAYLGGNFNYYNFKYER
jgi:hypothetical protein